jgi:hypothetical protein
MAVMMIPKIIGLLLPFPPPTKASGVDASMLASFPRALTRILHGDVDAAAVVMPSGAGW